MKNLHDKQIDQHRRRDAQIIQFFGNVGDDKCGSFEVASPIDGVQMNIIASSDGGWEHISVSRRNRIPNWIEMQHVKEMFFQENETVLQFHVPKNDHINIHDNCLHLWRSTEFEHMLPPPYMV